MQMPFERALVTGGTGFIGRYVTARLVAAGQRPTVTQFGLTPKEFGLTSEVNLVDLDLRDHAETANLVSSLRPDLVIHLAGVTGQSDPEGKLCDDINYRATVHLLDRLSASGVRKIVMVGTAAEYGAGPTPFREDQPDDPRSPYAVSRTKANRYALSLDLNAVILRLFSVYGIGQPGNMFLPQLIAHAVQGTEFLMSAGTQLRDFVHVEDVAVGLLAAAQVPSASGLINIGSGVGSRLSDVARMVWHYCGADDELLRIGALDASGDGAFDTLADISRAKSVIGWQPQRIFTTDTGPGEKLVEMIDHARDEQGARA